MPSRLFASIGTACLILAATIVASQGQPQRPAARPAPKPILPVAATMITADPDKYVGETVTMTAAVDQRLGDTVFSVRNTAKGATSDVLVIAPVLIAPVEPGRYVTVIGEVITFYPTTLTEKMKESTPRLTDDVIQRYRGRPALIATSVINSAMTDLAKVPPPPMTPEEEALSKVMKTVNPAFGALRQAVTASDAAEAGTQAAALEKAFGEAAAFWKTKTHPDATQWNDDAKRTAAEIRTAAGKADWDAVKAAVPKLQGACSSCHGAYRARLDDGTYRFKEPAR